MNRNRPGFEERLEKRLENPEFRAEWERLEPGYQVARLRIELGLTQQELAEHVGTKQGSISRLETGATGLDLGFLRRVVEALGAELTIAVRPGTSPLREHIRGVGEEYAYLLRRAGVETVSDLADEDPGELRDKLVQVNGKAQAVRRVPGRTTVVSWIEQARRSSSGLRAVV
jgi:transcriptional regulator with XRE-family HTH domain